MYTLQSWLCIEVSEIFSFHRLFFNKNNVSTVCICSNDETRIPENPSDYLISGLTRRRGTVLRNELCHRKSSIVKTSIRPFEFRYIKEKVTEGSGYLLYMNLYLLLVDEEFFKRVDNYLDSYRFAF